jgi:hypothetical protein
MDMQVRKEKLGDRITALQQLVSPFGKVNFFSDGFFFTFSFYIALTLKVTL